ncbi:MAG: phospho-N-acetylmuramoyl-pentapeptide-transferase, partial [Candidatus Eremiobacteraeota bacterium]|nr:phospho-N-acetylmuramoyl-pentapeptide-transferase [Candidatus Eremiobacteraeota bacterium]
MTELLLAAVLGFVLSAATGFALLRLLPRWQFRQVAYEDAPESHQGKTGTPTMGGICFAAALIPAWFSIGRDPVVGALVFLIFAAAAAGFLDDYLSIRRGKNLGLRARTKYLATALIAIIFLRMIAMDNVSVDMIGSFFGTPIIAPHWLWLVLGIIAVTGTVHAVNLTDGLDGLATGVAIPPLAVLAFVLFAEVFAGAALHEGSLKLSILALGGCLGFLIYNRYPAKVFMGDTGSLLLGATLAGLAIVAGEMLLLIVICAVPVAETLSVIIQ